MSPITIIMAFCATLPFIAANNGIEEMSISEPTTTRGQSTTIKEEIEQCQSECIMRYAPAGDAPTTTRSPVSKHTGVTVRHSPSTSSYATTVSI